MIEIAGTRTMLDVGDEASCNVTCRNGKEIHVEMANICSTCTWDVIVGLGNAEQRIRPPFAGGRPTGLDYIAPDASRPRRLPDEAFPGYLSAAHYSIHDMAVDRLCQMHIFKSGIRVGLVESLRAGIVMDLFGHRYFHGIEVSIIRVCSRSSGCYRHGTLGQLPAYGRLAGDAYQISKKFWPVVFVRIRRRGVVGVPHLKQLRG